MVSPSLASSMGGGCLAVMDYKIFIINLDRSEDRWQHVQEQLALWPDLPVERVSATDGYAASAAQINRYYSEEKNSRTYHKRLKPGEKGGFISHIRCWQKILDEDLDFALMLEDDFVVLEDLPQLLATIVALNQPWHLLKLAMPHKQQAVLRRQACGAFNLVHYKKNPISAVAQAVSREGARLLLDHEVPFGRPVDISMQYTWQLGFQALGLHPQAFRPAFTFESNISGKDNKQINRSLFFRLRGQFVWNNFRYNLRTYGWRATLLARRLRLKHAAVVPTAGDKT